MYSKIVDILPKLHGPLPILAAMEIRPTRFLPQHSLDITPIQVFEIWVWVCFFNEIVVFLNLTSNDRAIVTPTGVPKRISLHLFKSRRIFPDQFQSGGITWTNESVRLLL